MEGRGKERWKIKERKGREGDWKVENLGEEGEKNWGKKEMNKEEREEKKGHGW